MRRASAAEKERVRAILNDCLPADAHVRGMKLDIGAAKADGKFPMTEITCPVLAISAQDDAFETDARAREIAESVPNGRLVLFQTGGHLLAGRQNETVREVAAFLARVS
jgi:pimeloyl-ACP methyl ester carboxylesterase